MGGVGGEGLGGEGARTGERVGVRSVREGDAMRYDGAGEVEDALGVQHSLVGLGKRAASDGEVAALAGEDSAG